MGVEDQAAMKETVESLSSLGYLELIVRSDNQPAMRTLRDPVPMELKGRFGLGAIPPNNDSASAGKVETGEREGTNTGDCST